MNILVTTLRIPESLLIHQWIEGLNTGMFGLFDTKSF